MGFDYSAFRWNMDSVTPRERRRDTCRVPSSSCAINSVVEWVPYKNLAGGSNPSWRTTCRVGVKAHTDSRKVIPVRGTLYCPVCFFARSLKPSGAR